ncbi:hypothetical protein [Shewanella youngdeokensis]|uniref:Uncharacterized protein n=1 Tax=Shewanella youngdeokensis TaxID=2999068 RepID=A0ABZ0JV08_9GAMM|nr:hypothetical protein RGE70_12455 [Shewanella sp. DAU334]
MSRGNLKFKVASSILALYATIGFGVIIFSGFEDMINLLFFFVICVLIPAYGAYGTLIKNRIAIFVSMVLFIFQAFRSVGHDSLIPHIAPISVSFPVGNFSNGQGYLIDYFAILMALLLAWLFKIVITPNTYEPPANIDTHD